MLAVAPLLFLIIALPAASIAYRAGKKRWPDRQNAWYVSALLGFLLGPVLVLTGLFGLLYAVKTLHS